MKTMHLILTLALLTAAVVACGGDDDSDESQTPSLAASVSGTALPSETQSVEDEVGAAYLEYWDVYADAVFDLDGSRLEEVLTGSQLQRTLSEIAALQQRGRAAKIVVEHNFFVAEVDAVAGTATIRDDYTNSSYEVDSETKEMVGNAASGTVVSDTYFLVKEGGTWKVRDGIRQGE